MRTSDTQKAGRNAEIPPWALRLVTDGPLAAYRCEADGSYATTFISPSIVNQLGYEPDIFLEDPDFWRDNVHPEDGDGVIEALAALAEGERRVVEYRFRHSDGGWRWIRDELVLVCDEAGEPDHIIGYWVDITEHRSRAAAAEQRLLDFAEASSDWFWETDAEHRFKPFSGAGGPVIANLDETARGRTRYEMCVPADADAPKWAAHQATLDAHQPFKDFLYAATEEDGGVRYVRTSGKPVFDEDGAFLGYRGTATNVTQTVRSEERALAAQRGLAQAVDGLSETFLLFDKEDRLVLANQAWREHNAAIADQVGPGTPFEDILRASVQAGYYPQAIGREEAWIGDRLATHRRPHGPIDLPRGAHGHLLVRDHLLPDGRIVTTATDVSELKRREEELRLLNERLEHRVDERTRELGEKADQLQIALESISEGFALFDSDDRLVFCSDAYPRFLAPIAHLIKPGVPYETLVRATIEHGVADYPGETQEKMLESRLARHREQKGNFQVGLSDGRWLLVAERRTGDGSTVLLQTDITEVKRAEQEARSILDASPYAVGVSRISDGEFLYVNAGLAELLGIPAAEIIGRSAIDFWADPADRETFLDIFRRDNRVPATEVQLKRCDGSLFWGSLAWERLPLFGADALLFWGQDISDLVAAREEVHARQDAEAANRAKSEFLSQMSHELRTPLNAIIGFAQLLRDYPDQPLTREQAENVGQILYGGRHLLELIDGILDLARIEAGRLTLSLEPVDLPQAMRQSLVLIQPLADERGVSVMVAADIASAPAVTADAKRLTQVVLNLLSNAVKYNRDKGKVTVTAAAADSNMMRLSISDTGPGIADDKHDEVFQPFARLGAEASDIEGTGIGLTISRQLIESMGGRLDFDSEVGHGSTFWFELPLAEQQP